MKTYTIKRIDRPIHNLADWDSDPWDGIRSLRLGHFMGARPAHFPNVRAKLAYDENAIFVIFRVEDRFIRARKSTYQDRVCEDSCVEFFFTPGENRSAGYFNFEINCGGTAFFHHQMGRSFGDVAVAKLDFNQVEIAHSMPKVVDPEIDSAMTWVVAYRLPFAVLAKYAPFTSPQLGDVWWANFYKCADESSRPHWLTWAPVDLPDADFHQPAFFGKLIFD